MNIFTASFQIFRKSSNKLLIENDMEVKAQTSREYFRSLQIVFYALIAGQFIFAMIALFIRQMRVIDTVDGLDDIFLFIVPLFIIGGITGNWLFFNNRIKASILKTSMVEKMSDYRAILIIRYALLEGPTLLAIIVFLMTGNLLFLGMAGIVIIVFLVLRPSPQRAVKDLQLNPFEEQSVLDPDKIIAEIKTNGF
jgi:hypothetical protein